MKENLTKHWRIILTEWQSSGISQKRFCQEKNLAFTTFGYWRTKIKKLDTLGPVSKSEDSPFIQHTLPTLNTSLAYVLEWPDGMRLRIPVSLQKSEVTAMVTLLRDTKR